MTAAVGAMPAGGTAGRVLREEVYARLVDMIVSGEIPPGEAVREHQTAELLGTSRLPVREALQQLEAEGWLERRPRGIARVRVPQVTDVDEIFDMRRLLEVEAITLAVRRASMEDVARLRALADRGAEAAASGDQAAAMRLNGEFHHELAVLTHHGLLNDFLEILERKVHWLFSNVRMDRFAEHDALLNALEARDVEAARSCVREHIDRTHELLREKWGHTFSEAPGPRRR